MGTGGQCDVKTIIHENASTCPTHGGNARRHQTIQWPTLQVALANLNEVHALARSRSNPLDERLLPRRAVAAPVGNETEDGFQTGSG
jgi:hypothetical protein